MWWEVHYDTEQLVQPNTIDLQNPVQMSDQFNKHLNNHDMKISSPQFTYRVKLRTQAIRLLILSWVFETLWVCRSERFYCLLWQLWRTRNWLLVEKIT
jgi:hypothetical protein